jgi:oxygen-independent coproporphyrinogen III oxidase
LAGLYFHIPFCTQRCVYCDFYFVTTRRDHGSFVAALLTEIEAYAAEYAGREAVETIYIGGGTPSLLALDDVGRLLDAALRHFDCSAVRELTFEVNPENVTLEYLSGLRALGVTRLSLGVQSFFDEDLQFMNRAHDAGHAHRAIETIRRVGFETFSVDLIFGSPGQIADRWLANLDLVASLEIPHISTYSLTIEEKTPLWKSVQRGLIDTTPDEVMSERFAQTMEILGEHGYEHYEISSFARPGARSLHNQLYWRHGNYLGMGPSAHSFWRESGARARRWSNVRNLRQYEALLQQRQLPLDATETLGPDDLADEYVMLRLRLPEDGVDLDEMEARYGVDLLDEKIDELAGLEEAGLITFRNRRIRLTPRGALVADSVTARLLPHPTT